MSDHGEFYSVVKDGWTSPPADYSAACDIAAIEGGQVTPCYAYVLTDGDEVFDRQLMTEEQAKEKNADAENYTDGNVYWASGDQRRKNNQDFDQLIDRLASKGFDICEVTAGQRPFEVTANHQEGWSIYFRACAGIASLEIYDCRWIMDLSEEEHLFWDDEHLLWDGEFKSRDGYEAGWWITPNTADYALSLLLADGLEYLDLPVSK